MWVFSLTRRRKPGGARAELVRGQRRERATVLPVNVAVAVAFAVAVREAPLLPIREPIVPAGADGGAVGVLLRLVGVGDALGVVEGRALFFFFSRINRVRLRERLRAVHLCFRRAQSGGSDGTAAGSNVVGRALVLV